MRAHHHARSQRPRRQDDQDAGRRVRRRVRFGEAPRGDLVSEPAATATFGVEAINMTKRFGEFVALDQVALKVKAGTFHALLGENGAGKSTLVKCIMGYYLPDAGEVI